MKDIVFGPVYSRRFGRSLGVSLVPHKICNLNCVYCEVGPTSSSGSGRQYYYSWNDIKELFLKALNNKKIDVITITGFGEPTLNLHLRDIVENIKKHTDIPLVLITNSLLLTDPEVRNDVMGFSIISPSLDSVVDKHFKDIDRPLVNVTSSEISEGLVSLKKEFLGKIFLEIFLLKNVNDSEEDINELKKTIDRMKPDEIHLNTLARQPVKHLQALTYDELADIKKLLGNGFNIKILLSKKEEGAPLVETAQFYRGESLVDLVRD